MKKLKLILCMILGLLLFGAVGAQAAGKKAEMDKAKAIATLQVGFNYSYEEIGNLFDTGINYQELKIFVCMRLSQMYRCKKLWTYAKNTVGQELNFCLV